MLLFEAAFLWHLVGVGNAFRSSWFKVKTVNRFLGKCLGGMDGAFEAVVSGKEYTVTTGNLMQPFELSNTLSPCFPNTPKK